MALGKQLQQAREKLDLSPSEVAAATRIKVQLVEAIEAEDFDRLVAPIYAKGFLKMYAEYVGLDPAPLIREYMNHVEGGGKPSLKSEGRRRRREKKEKKADLPGPLSKDGPEPDLFTEDEKPGAAVKEDRPPGKSRAHPRVPAAETLRAFGKRLSQGRQAAVSAVVEGVRTVRGKWDGARALRQLGSLTNSPQKAASVGVGIIITLIFVVSGFSRCVRDTRPDGTEAPMPPPEELELALDLPPPYVE